MGPTPALKGLKEQEKLFDGKNSTSKISCYCPCLFEKKGAFNKLQTMLANTKKLTGLIVVKDLEIKKENQNPCFGFIIQKAQYDAKHLSDYTQKRLSHFNPGQKVIALKKGNLLIQ